MLLLPVFRYPGSNDSLIDLPNADYIEPYRSWPFVWQNDAESSVLPAHHGRIHLLHDGFSLPHLHR